MEFDNSWRALFRPGAADAYFEFAAARPDAANPQEFSAATALWLAELSRLAYQTDPARRARLLRAAGCDEVATVVAGSTAALLVSGQTFSALVFRGTSEPDDWKTNLESLREAWPAGGTVHSGFRAALLGVWDAVACRLEGVSSPLFFTGHSLGGALAQLAASLVPPAAVYTFGAPRVGDRAFVRLLARVPAYRIVNRADLVAALPPALAGYKHAGRLCFLDERGDLEMNPSRTRVYGARVNGALSLLDMFQAAPDLLADHAPVNYVSALARYVARAGENRA